MDVFGKAGFTSHYVQIASDFCINESDTFLDNMFWLLREVVAVEIIDKSVITSGQYPVASVDFLLQQKNRWQFEYLLKEAPLPDLLAQINACLYQSQVAYQVVAYPKTKQKIQVLLLNEAQFEAHQDQLLRFPDFPATLFQFAQPVSTLLPVASVGSIKDKERKALTDNPLYFGESPHFFWFRQQNRLAETEAPDIWYQLFGQLLTLKNAQKPSKKEKEVLQELIEAISPKVFGEQLLRFVAFFQTFEHWWVSERVDWLKGLVWASTFAPTAATALALARLVEKAYQPTKSNKLLAKSLGQLGLEVLQNLPIPEALLELWKLKNRSQNPKLLQAINKCLGSLRKTKNLTEQDLEERLLPHYGLGNGKMQQKIGDFRACLEVQKNQKIIVTWENSQGKVQKSIPALLKRTASLEVANFKQTAQEIKRTLQKQKKRLENAWREDRAWDYTHWEKYIFWHPLLHLLSSQLIWQFEAAGQRLNAFFWQGVWCNAQGEELLPDKQAKVRLWHPVESSIKEVVAWRNFLFEQQLVQPFKQAFREVYVLTDAERATQTYSNRFSAHILHSKKLWALSQQRQWKSKDRGFGAAHVPCLRLPAYQLQVCLELSFTAAAYLSTQRLSFYEGQGATPQELTDISPVAFSEIMRDVDLFVAIASIGNDPNWTGAAEYESYWYDYAFGEKSNHTSAKERKKLLEKIIPNLKIAPQCRFEGNFLCVKGQLRGYKIHLGSANILMEPNDEYLCIVPEVRQSSISQQVFLPFEQDTILSLILSKAFLLAADETITDKVILNQIFPEN